MDDEAGVYGPGHNSFTTSPDGSETWIVYHATSGINDGWSNRKARAQLVSWDEQGMPVFGKPLSLDTAITVPSGEGVYRAEHAELKEGKLLFNHIPTSLPSEISVLLHYSSDSAASHVELFINGKKSGTLKLPQTTTGTTGYAWASLPFEAGMNQLGVQPAAGATITALELTRYEAENGQGGNGALTESNPFASGWGIAVGSSDGEGTLQLPNIVVPEAGEYQVSIAISNRSDSEQDVQLKLNGEKTERVTIAPGDRQKFAVITVALKLQKGVNEITFDKLPQSIAIDYIDVLR